MYIELIIRSFFTDEQERVQKKTFVNWINSYLSKVSSIIYVTHMLLIIIVCVIIDLDNDMICVIITNVPNNVRNLFSTT